MRDIEKMLGEYKEIETRIETLKMDLENIDRYGVSAIDYSLDRVQVSPCGNATENTAVKRIEKEREIDLAQAKLKIMDRALEALPELDRDIIRYKVIEGEPWFKLCSKLHICEQHLRKKKKDALLVVKKILA